MLILKRKLGEAIIITTESGEKIEIKVSEISDGRVKLGLDASKSISILRKEVVEEAKSENTKSTQSNNFDKAKLKDIIKKDDK